MSPGGGGERLDFSGASEKYRIYVDVVCVIAQCIVVLTLRCIPLHLWSVKILSKSVPPQAETRIIMHYIVVELYAIMKKSRCLNSCHALTVVVGTTCPDGRRVDCGSNGPGVTTASIARRISTKVFHCPGPHL